MTLPQTFSLRSSCPRHTVVVMLALVAGELCGSLSGAGVLDHGETGSSSLYVSFTAGTVVPAC